MWSPRDLLHGGSVCLSQVSSGPMRELQRSDRPEATSVLVSAKSCSVTQHLGVSAWAAVSVVEGSCWQHPATDCPLRQMRWGIWMKYDSGAHRT